MGNWRKKISTILTYFFLILFVWFYTGITMFYHTHRLYGNTIVHSHPDYSSNKTNDSEESHSHSPEVFNLIQQIDSIDWVNDVFIPDAPEPVVFDLSCSFELKLIPGKTRSKNVLSLRAPPVSITTTFFC